MIILRDTLAMAKGNNCEGWRKSRETSYRLTRLASFREEIKMDGS